LDRFFSVKLPFCLAAQDTLRLAWFFW
jgi:hypothetical protein